MANVSIHSQDNEIRVVPLTHSDDGTVFFVLSVGSDCSIFLKGCDLEAADNARAAAASNLENTIANRRQAAVQS